LCLEALPAVDRASLTRFKWDLGGLAAVCADHVEHLAWSATARTHAGIAIVVPFAAPLGTTRRAPDRVHEPSFTEEFLLPGSKYELRTAIATFDDFVFPDHVSPDFLTCERCAVADVTSHC
jgi:hypothetical protein